MKHKTLRRLIEEGELVQAPGVYDALTAKIVEAEGFNAVYMTGYGVCASSFAFPDYGLLTMTEMVENASRIADAVEIPLIGDADTGYGNPINVVRTIREYEKAGVAAIQIEDQVWPKRCGHMSGKKVIDLSEMEGKIKAAADTRRNDDFLIITRTDAIATDGFEHAIERGLRFAEAGADIIFIEAPVNKEQVSMIPKLIPDKPLLLNLAPLTPNFSADEIREMGYAIAIYPGVCLAGAVSGCIDEVKRLKASGKQRDFSEWVQTFTEFNTLLGVTYYQALEQKYKI
ncbi:MAG: isocitrate lyase/PEP mutase family protein [Deltaproteobacteria bacterium]|nr:isocitrate lyase/PEP mutase family protein [Deltaproteobacteria bacterium]